MKTKFQQPSIQECELQAAKIGLCTQEAHKFYYHYDAIGWMVGKNPMVSWKSAMAGWKLRNQEYSISDSRMPQKRRLTDREYLEAAQG